MLSHNQGSTQPFNSAEIQAILAEAGNPSRLPEPPPEHRPETMAVVARPDLDLVQLMEAFNHASLDSPPNTRLVISSPRWADLEGSAVVPFPRGIGTWGLVSVVQRTYDVYFDVSLPIDGPPNGPPNLLHFNIYYDPGKDSCALRNRMRYNISLSSLGAEAARIHIQTQGYHALSPGLWRLSLVGDGTTVEQHVLDLLILRRQFTIQIHKSLADPSASGKRKAREDLDVASKRSKQKDETEILLVPNTKLLPPLSGPITAALAPLPMASYGVSLVNSGTPLLYLENGDTAIVQASQSRGDKAEGPATYDLSRLERIAVTPSASVFTARHTALDHDVVAKVIRYEGNTLGDLITCARTWTQEVHFLQKLSHVSVTLSFFLFRTLTLPFSLALTLSLFTLFSVSSSPSISSSSEI